MEKYYFLYRKNIHAKILAGSSWQQDIFQRYVKKHTFSARLKQKR